MEEKVKKYQTVILEFLEEQTSFRMQSSESEIQTVIDTDRHHYQLLRLGWRKGRFVHLCLFHFDMVDGKIWLQQNRTDTEIGEYLLSHGVPNSDVVLGFVEPSLRQYASYAVA